MLKRCGDIHDLTAKHIGPGADAFTMLTAKKLKIFAKLTIYIA